MTTVNTNTEGIVRAIESTIATMSDEARQSLWSEEPNDEARQVLGTLVEALRGSGASVSPAVLYVAGRAAIAKRMAESLCWDRPAH